MPSKTKTEAIKETKEPSVSYLLKGKKLLLPILGVVILILALGFIFKSLFVAAVINNHPITRYELDKELERQGGQQVLDSKVTEILILQEAKKQKIEISQADVDAKVKSLEDQITAQGQNLDTLLQQQKQTRADLNQQVKIQLIIEKMIGSSLQATDEEAKVFFDANKSYYPQGTTFESQKESIKSQLVQQKMSEKFQTLIADLKQKSKSYYFLQL